MSTIDNQESSHLPDTRTQKYQPKYQKKQQPKTEESKEKAE